MGQAVSISSNSCNTDRADSGS